MPLSNDFDSLDDQLTVHPQHHNDLADAVNRIEARVVDVAAYGAVGDGVADDTAAINTALAAAEVLVPAGGVGPRVVFPPAAGYRTTAGLVVPDGVEVDMRAPIVYDGPGGETALAIGSAAGNVSHESHVVWVRRAALADWTDADDVGVLATNLRYCQLRVIDIRNFHTGLVCLGDAAGWVYNHVELGLLIDNKISVELTNTGGGWCNQNLFLGGEFSVSSATHTTVDRVGVLVGSRDGGYTNNNGNLFKAPSFEIKGDGIAAAGTCVQVDHGTLNRWEDCRHESPDTVSLVTANASALNVFTTLYNASGSIPTASDTGTYAGSYVEAANNTMVLARMRPIYSVPDMHLRACYYDGGTSVNVPGLSAGTSSTTPADTRAISSITINADSLSWGATRTFGVYVSTVTVKRFMVACDTDSGFGGRVRVRCYDSAGSVITTGTPIRRQSGSGFSFSTSYGGAWSTGSDSNTPVTFEVDATVTKMLVMVSGGTAVIKIRSFEIYAAANARGAASVWTAQLDNGDNWGTAAPTAGTWEVGRRVWNAAPAAGGVPGWVCTTAGSPGTWKAMASLAA